MTLAADLSVIVQTALTVIDVNEDQGDPALGPAFADSFWAVAILALAVFLLGFDLMRRLRRAKYRAEIQEELAPEVAAMQAAKAAEAAGAAGVAGAAEAAEAAEADAGGVGGVPADPGGASPATPDASEQLPAEPVSDQAADPEADAAADATAEPGSDPEETSRP